MTHNKKIYLALIFLLIFRSIGYSEAKRFGKASWYSKDDNCDPFPHITTASGEKFNENDLTCALRDYNFGGYYQVCNIANNKCVTVKHNDFGPGEKMALKGRIVDLSKRAFSVIANLDIGVINVSVERIK